MADQQQLDLLQQGTTVWNTWRTEHQETHPDLRGAVLFRANLNGADLRGANLFRADLSEANLSRANLNRANLSRADLSRADLIGADLIGADLSRADLSAANLNAANLNEANLNEAYIGWTVFGGVDLRSVKGLETVKHAYPSTIGANTLIRSQGDIPEVFLRGVGLPDTFIEYIRSLISRPIDYYTCFLSYSSQDDAFVTRLHADLQQHGVRCWFAPHSLRPGDPILSRIDETIRLYDKLVLVLSQYAVQSRWVELEVNSAQTKEVHQGCQMLFPLRLDETVMSTTSQWARSLREQRHIADFTGWKDHDTYQHAFTRLLKDLQAESKPMKP